MQVGEFIVDRVEVNVVNDFTRLRARDLPVFPFASVAFRAVAQIMDFVGLSLGPARLFDRWGHARNSGWHGRRRRHHPVSTTLVRPRRKSVFLFLVCVKRIAVLTLHQIVTDAQIFCRHGALAMQARPSNNLPTPAILSRPMSLHSLVVHETIPVGSVSPLATINRASSVKPRRGHCNSFIDWLPRYSAAESLFNSMAVPCVRWILSRLEAVDAQ